MNPRSSPQSAMQPPAGDNAAHSDAPSLLPAGFRHASVAGYVDRIEGAPLPLVRVFGWYASSAMPELAVVTGGGRFVPASSISRCRREDVLAAGASQELFSGFRADFVLTPGERPEQLLVGGNPVHRFPPDQGFSTLEPHYFSFFLQTMVMGRESIYGQGPPTDLPEEYKEFATMASGKVLDFGSGNGDLVIYLRSRGREACGLELDQPRIRDALKADAAPHVTLYGGGCPLPFADATFDWIVSTEVIEHVPVIQTYVAEFARILKPGGRMLLTTPDITSIPSSFPANCVPWHLLEATHVNFFTPQSVAGLFAPCFRLDSLYCLGAGRVNGWFVPGSIGAAFTRHGDHVVA